MQQPMMLDNILKLCQKEHPSFSACKTACAKARGRRGLRALERHRVPFCVYSARPHRAWCLGCAGRAGRRAGQRLEGRPRVATALG